MIYPLKFHPILKSVIWGGEKISTYKDLELSQKNIGESWELSGLAGEESIISNGEFAGRNIAELLKEYGAEIVGAANYERFGNEFPLLIKFIDAHSDLSIQVHPDNKLAAERHNSKGKAEMWYIVGADEGAKIRLGFSHEIKPEEYIERVANNTITDIVQIYEIAKGDLFFLPAGRIHSIGAGCFIAEIQQTSDITYRIYDYNRRDAEGKTRELHTEQALQAIEYNSKTDYRLEYERELTNQAAELVECPYFSTFLLNLTDSYVADYSDLDSFVIYICIEGEAMVNSTPLRQGETLLLPATTQKVNIDTASCKILIAYIK